MIEIPLRKTNLVTLISDRDAQLAEYTWSWSEALGVIRYDGKGYDKDDQRTPHAIMAREITDTPPGSFVVHVNKKKFDNQRYNLLVMSPSQHAQYNRKARGKSGFIGVKEKKYVFSATIQGKHIGNFDSPEEAAHAYDASAIEVFGESAQLNFPRPFKVCHECHRGFFRLATATACAECAKKGNKA